MKALWPILLVSSCLWSSVTDEREHRPAEGRPSGPPESVPTGGGLPEAPEDDDGHGGATGASGGGTEAIAAECEALPYEPRWECQWQACIDIESNSRPYRCSEDGVVVGVLPAGLSCWPIWVDAPGPALDYCCCNTGSCVPD